MPRGPYEKPLHIDLPFGEALERFAQTDLGELPDNVKLKRKRKKAGGAKPPASPPTSAGPKGARRSRTG